MFEALKSRYMTGFSASCKKERPLAAPSAIFILDDHGNETEYPVITNIYIYVLDFRLLISRVINASGVFRECFQKKQRLVKVRKTYF